MNSTKLLVILIFACPDGFPVALASKILYKNNQMRVDGLNYLYKQLEISE